MIITVTLNPCLHHILAFEEPDDRKIVIKPVRSFFQPGGKGLNAARIVRAMGAEVLALTTWGAEEGQLLLREVGYSDVPVKSLEVSRPTRISTCFYNVTCGSFMELLESGVELLESEVESLFALFLESLPGAGYVALNGSSPCRTADDFFRRAAESARHAGAMVVVDSYSNPMIQAVKAGPHMVKMNTQEIRLSFGREINGEKDLHKFAHGLQEGGIDHVLITDGSRGAWLFSKDVAFKITVPEVRELHAIGSGDAMVGAMLARLEMGDPLEEACRWGAAAGAVNASRLEVCSFSRSLVEELLPSVTMEAVKVWRT